MNPRSRPEDLQGFARDLLPEPVSYFEGLGLRLEGRGKWRTTRCEFHGGSDSMRVNVAGGAFCCMNCRVRGGDVVAYEMTRTGADFVTAARALGAWRGAASGSAARQPSRTLAPRDAMELVVLELNVLLVVIADVRRGVIPDDATWHRYLSGVARITHLTQEYST